MPVTWLLTSVVVGVVLVTLAITAAGWWETAAVDEAAARALFAADYPGEPIHDVMVAKEGVLFEVNGGFVVVFPVGACLVIRRVLTEQVERTPTSVRIDFRDFGAPRIELACA